KMSVVVRPSIVGLRMDPTDNQDTPTIQQALSHQGRLLGQHEQSILALHASNQQLSQQVTILTQQISAWLSLQSNASAQPAQPTPPSPQQVEQGPGPREPAISDPEHFAGQSELCRGFLFQCSTVFNQRPSSFSSDISRIQYMCGLMRGRALKWAEARFSNTYIMTCRRYSVSPKLCLSHHIDHMIAPSTSFRGHSFHQADSTMYPSQNGRPWRNTLQNPWLRDLFVHLNLPLVLVFSLSLRKTDL
uniref:DUF4939 domain-containing protein n=1 Tax=Gouania willdenowi TaxID=441366 RepID=A0A8C5H773_GOUWI